MFLNVLTVKPLNSSLNIFVVFGKPIFGYLGVIEGNCYSFSFWHWSCSNCLQVCRLPDLEIFSPSPFFSKRTRECSMFPKKFLTCQTSRYLVVTLLTILVLIEWCCNYRYASVLPGFAASVLGGE